MNIVNDLYWTEPEKAEYVKLYTVDIMEGNGQSLILACDKENTPSVFVSLSENKDKISNHAIIGKFFYVDSQDVYMLEEPDGISYHACSLDANIYDFYVKRDGTIHWFFPIENDVSHYMYTSQETIGFELDAIKIGALWLQRYLDHKSDAGKYEIKKYFHHHLPESLLSDTEVKYEAIKPPKMYNFRLLENPGEPNPQWGLIEKFDSVEALAFIIDTHLGEKADSLTFKDEEFIITIGHSTDDTYTPLCCVEKKALEVVQQYFK